MCLHRFLRLHRLWRNRYTPHRFCYCRCYLHHRSRSGAIIFRNLCFFLLIPIKAHSSHKNCQCQTHRSRIRKNRSFLFSPFLRIFTVYDLSEISDSPVLHFLGCLSALFLATFDHIRLHLRIFLIINIIPAQFCHHAAIITEKSILPFSRIHQHQDLFPSEMSEMYFHKKLRDLHCYLRLCKKPSHDLLLRKILILILLQFLPEFFRKVNMFCRSLHAVCCNGTFYKNTGHICSPLNFTCKYRHTSLAFRLFIFCQAAEKCVYIIFYINPVISVRQPDLPYISRHGKRFLCGFLFCCVLLINDFYHLISLLLSKHSTVKMRILAECKSLSTEFSDRFRTMHIFPFFRI